MATEDDDFDEQDRLMEMLESAPVSAVRELARRHQQELDRLIAEAHLQLAIERLRAKLKEIAEYVGVREEILVEAKRLNPDGVTVRDQITTLTQTIEGLSERNNALNIEATQLRARVHELEGGGEDA